MLFWLNGTLLIVVKGYLFWKVKNVCPFRVYSYYRVNILNCQRVEANCSKMQHGWLFLKIDDGSWISDFYFFPLSGLYNMFLSPRIFIHLSSPFPQSAIFQLHKEGNFLDLPYIWCTGKVSVQHNCVLNLWKISLHYFNRESSKRRRI